ncbi:unnamed protein product, partial [Rotaria magnacalcarata]
MGSGVVSITLAALATSTMTGLVLGVCTFSAKDTIFSNGTVAMSLSSNAIFNLSNTSSGTT